MSAMENFQPHAWGPFFLLERIGRGSMAEVFRARADQLGGRMVALKRIRKKYMYDTDFIQMLESEARTLQALHHTNLIEVYSFGKYEERFYLVMEYVAGQSLRELLKISTARSIPVPPPAIIFLFQQVAQALSHLHGITDQTGNPAPLIHTDLGARNILVGWGGEVKLIDFSIEQTEFNLKTRPTEGHWGLLQEMPPERLQEETMDPRSDLFQLGLVLYHLLCGRELFEGRHGFGLYVAIVDLQLSDSDFPAELAPELKSILHGCLARDPSRRYRSAAVLSGALHEHLAKISPGYGPESFVKALAAFR